MEQTKTLTLDTSKYYESMNSDKNGQVDYLTDLILEYYEDGKYDYKNFKDSKTVVEQPARTEKFNIKKWVSSVSTKKYIGIILDFIFEIDDEIPKRQREKIIELKKELNEIKNKEDKDINKRIAQEAELRLEHYVEERDERIKKQSARIQDLTAKNHILEQTILDQRNKINDLIKEKNDTQLGLEVECKKVKKKLKKQKKKKKKKKKSYSSSDSDSSDSDYEYNNVSGGD